MQQGRARLCACKQPAAAAPCPLRSACSPGAGEASTRPAPPPLSLSAHAECCSGHAECCSGHAECGSRHAGALGAAGAGQGLRPHIDPWGGGSWAGETHGAAQPALPPLPPPAYPLACLPAAPTSLRPCPHQPAPLPLAPPLPLPLQLCRCVKPDRQVRGGDELRALEEASFQRWTNSLQAHADRWGGGAMRRPNHNTQSPPSRRALVDQRVPNKWHRCHMSGDANGRGHCMRWGVKPLLAGTLWVEPCARPAVGYAYMARKRGHPCPALAAFGPAAAAAAARVVCGGGGLLWRAAVLSLALGCPATILHTPITRLCPCSACIHTHTVTPPHRAPNPAPTSSARASASSSPSSSSGASCGACSSAATSPS